MSPRLTCRVALRVDWGVVIGDDLSSGSVEGAGVPEEELLTTSVDVLPSVTSSADASVMWAAVELGSTVVDVAVVVTSLAVLPVVGTSPTVISVISNVVEPRNMVVVSASIGTVLPLDSSSATHMHNRIKTNTSNDSVRL